MTLRTVLPALALGLCPLAAPALTLDFPAPVTVTADEVREADEARFPMAPFDGTRVAMRSVDGQVTRQAWRLAAARMTTLQILAPLRAQLQADGFKVLFECQDDVCGGYDFRFATDVLGEPAMHVDLGDFRYLLAEKETGVTVALMVSRSASSGFVQLTRVGGEPPLADVLVTSSKSVGFSTGLLDAAPLGGLSETGRAPLDDLVFQTGSSDLEGRAFPSLETLAGFLHDHPDLAVTLVGHTDSAGGLPGNIALSRRRAEAVRTALIRLYDVPAAQVSAEGVGYLAPRATNATEGGRHANRRVEVVLNQ
ncbi:MAG: OmpA family protein [Rhodobacterales bacterium]|nr:OmpA family protein [Rhodobacterales bacterium]